MTMTNDTMVVVVPNGVGNIRFSPNKMYGQATLSVAMMRASARFCLCQAAFSCTIDLQAELKQDLRSAHLRRIRAILEAFTCADRLEGQKPMRCGLQRNSRAKLLARS